MLRKTLVIAAAALGLAVAAQPTLAASGPKEPRDDVRWSFEGPFGRFDQEQLQRGYKVYHDVCSSCHSLRLMSYRNLGQPGGPFFDAKYPNPNDNPYVKALVKDFQVPDIDGDTGDAIKRPATPADTFISPFANDAAARASNGGALPPDLSLIVKAREDGPRYVYSILTGYEPAPAGVKVPDGKYYNPYFPNGLIGMSKQLLPDRVSYDDGFKATSDQEAQDVVAFLAWTAEPHMEERKKMGFSVMLYLLAFTGLIYASYRRIWRHIAH
jgi:ubiquinol-cytochrome c reductase cytochrome c1 subunit